MYISSNDRKQVSVVGLGIIIVGPLLLWLLAFLPIAGLRRYRRVILALILLVNYASIIALGLPNYFWVIAFASSIIGLLVVIDQVNRHFDLVIGRFLHEFGRWLLLATTLWWLTGIILKIVG